MKRDDIRYFFIDFEAYPLPLKLVFLYELIFIKLRNYLKRWGGIPFIFSIFGFKILFREKWRRFYILILQGHGSLMFMEFFWGIL